MARTQKAKWGNPDTDSFERYNTRIARYGDSQVRVHLYLWNTVERLLTAMGKADIPLTTLHELDDPLKRGFALTLSDQDAADIIPQLAAVGLEYASGEFRFTGEAAEAENISHALETSHPEPEQVTQGEAETEVAPQRPAAASEPQMVGTPDMGDISPLVRFVQSLTGAPDTGVWDDESVSALKSWQQRHGVAETGLMDSDTWSQVIPARIGWLRPGATGHMVKVIQAGFFAHGYYPRLITGIWGIEMSRSLRQFQADHGIHQRLRIGNPEWDALFDRNSRVMVSTVDTSVDTSVTG